MTKRETIFNKYDGKCAYCGCSIKINRNAPGDQQVMQVDHLKPIMRNWDHLTEDEIQEREHIDNLVPSCHTCNNFKSMDDLERFRAHLQDQIRVELENCNVFKRLVKYGLVEIVDKPIIFHFEKQR